jgi:Uncharacterized protein conserved in bacteria (DUF2171)
MAGGDPASWMVVEPGWKVVSADDEGVGRVDEVVGDTNADIFTGLKVLTGLLAKPKYVPSEQVGEITEGCVRLKLTHEEAEHLTDWDDVPAA